MRWARIDMGGGCHRYPSSSQRVGPRHRRPLMDRQPGFARVDADELLNVSGGGFWGDVWNGFKDAVDVAAGLIAIGVFVFGGSSNGNGSPAGTTKSTGGTSSSLGLGHGWM